MEPLNQDSDFYCKPLQALVLLNYVIEFDMMQKDFKEQIGQFSKLNEKNKKIQEEMIVPQGDAAEGSGWDQACPVPRFNSGRPHQRA